MTSAYDIVDCDGSKGFPASDAIASYSHEYIDEFDNNRFTPLMSVDSKKFAERERCVVIPEKLFSDLIGTDPKSMDAEVTRATLVAVEQIVNRDLEILLSSAKDAIAGIKNDPDVSFDMLKKYKIPFERTRVATRLWFRESTPDVLGIHIYVYPDGDVDNVALLNNPERIVGTDLTEREYPLIDYLIIPLVARVVFDAFTVHIANAGLADEDECRLMVSVTLGYHPRDALRRSMLVKKVPVRDNLGVVLADTQHIGYTYSWLGFLGKKAWNPTLLDFSTIFESKPQTEGVPTYLFIWEDSLTDKHTQHSDNLIYTEYRRYPSGPMHRARCSPRNIW